MSEPPRRRHASISHACALLLVWMAPDAHALSGAELIRNTPQRHGRFEARMRFAAGDGIVSSLFLWKPGSELADAYWNEIDIEKVGADCQGYSSNAIYGNPELQSTVRVHASSDLCSEYHTHSLEWTPEHLVWRLDGVEQRRLMPGELAAFEDNAPAGMQIRFNLWVGDASFGGVFASSSLPARQYIDWVGYSSYTPAAGPDGGDFTPLWREEFESALGAEWSLGTWPSPLGNSTHSPANVTLANGVVVLSLTEDDATGFTGTPPIEGSAGAAGSAGSGSGGAGASAGSGNAASGGERRRAEGGCALVKRRVGTDLCSNALLAAIAFGATCRRAARRLAK
jgi:endo-1,3-1,4-beta-glycanase ExoK